MQNNFCEELKELEELVFFDLWIPESGFRVFGLPHADNQVGEGQWRAS